MLKSIATLLFLIIPNFVFAADFSGNIALEYRQFFHNEQFPSQNSGSGTSGILEPEFYHKSKNRDHSFGSKLFYRYDEKDSQRTHFDIRQLDYTLNKKDYEIRAGISKVYWGVAESRHLVDIINQVDALEDVDDEERLGQPMVQISKFTNLGDFRFFYLPYFRKREFSEKESRLRSASLVSNDEEVYDQSAKELYPSFALRYEKSAGDFDIGIAGFHGISREASFTLRNNQIVPFYQTINQASIDVQHTHDALLLKLESIYRQGQGSDFIASTTGFEYTFFGIFGAHDLGFLSEYHFDGRDMNAPQTIFDEDLFFGLRYVLNNVSDTHFLAGITSDLNGNGSFGVVEASHRINNHLKAEFNLRVFDNIKKTDPFSFLNQDDFATLRISYFF